jgi:hypothetical protein
VRGRPHAPAAFTLRKLASQCAFDKKLDGWKRIFGMMGKKEIPSACAENLILVAQ